MFEMSHILVCTMNHTILVTGPGNPDRTPSPRRPENYEGMMYQTSMKDSEISTRTLCAMVKLIGLIGLYIYILYL